MDTPVILAALPARLNAASRRRWPKSSSRHFFPAEHSRRAWFTNSLNYYLAALFFNAFPLPQREAGARQTLVHRRGPRRRLFGADLPGGRRTQTGEIDRFRPGIGMIGARLDVPVVPVRIEGLDKVLHHLEDGEAGAGPGRLRQAAAAGGRRLRGAGGAGRERRAGPLIQCLVEEKGLLAV